MSLRLYMNHHVRFAISNGLRRRGVDVLTAYEDERSRAEDPILLERSTELERILFSQDRDLLAHAADWQRTSRLFHGVVYAHQLAITVGQCVNELELVCRVYEPADVLNRVVYLPM